MTTPSTPRGPKKSSRAATPRPRKIAGGGLSSDPDAPVEESEAEEPEAEIQPDTPDEPPPGDAWPVEGPEDRDAEGGSVFSSPRLTRLLLIVAAALAVVLIAEAGWAVVRWATEDDPPKPAPAAEGAISVPKDRPAQPTEVVVQAGVEAAAKAVQKIVNRTYQNYDAEVDASAALMSDEFAKEYLETTDDVRDAFIASKTTVQVRVVGQGVVRANDTELQALVFLNQSVTRETGKDPKTSYTPYRALLTMVNTDDGWLVDDLQTE